MKIDVITIFPELFTPFFQTGMLKIAQEKQLVSFTAHNLRDFTADKHKQVDDEPYGGGPGMVMKPEPFFTALQAVLGSSPFLLSEKVRTVLLTPRGVRLNQQLVQNLAGAARLVFLCGRYEGVDERVASFVTDEISIGDYILSGGEVAAMVIIEAVTRLKAGVLGEVGSLVEESFSQGLIEYPQYTRPAQWLNMSVPEVLLSGNHQAIKKWRHEQALLSTKLRRPDLWAARSEEMGGDS